MLPFPAWCWGCLFFLSWEAKIVHSYILGKTDISYGSGMCEIDVIWIVRTAIALLKVFLTFFYANKQLKILIL